MTVSSRSVHFHPNDGIDGYFVIRYLESHPEVRELRVDQLFARDYRCRGSGGGGGGGGSSSISSTNTGISKRISASTSALPVLESDDAYNYNNNSDSDDDDDNNTMIHDNYNNNSNDNPYLKALDQVLVQHHTVIHLKSLHLVRNGFMLGTSDNQWLARIVSRQFETLIELNLSHNPLGATVSSTTATSSASNSSTSSIGSSSTSSDRYHGSGGSIGATSGSSTSSTVAMDLLEVLTTSAPNLQILNLTDTKLGTTNNKATCTAIASLLRRNSYYDNNNHDNNSNNKNKNNRSGSSTSAGTLSQKSGNNLKELYIGNNDIGTRGIGIIAPELANNYTLEVLDVSYNKLKTRGASLLAKAMMQQQQQQQNSISGGDSSSLSKLRILDVTCNNIGEKGMQSFAKVLSMDKTLEGFYVGSNNLGWEGAALIASVLKVNYKLTDVRLSDNNIGNDGAALIATEGLTENDTRNTAMLEYLDLSWNGIGDDGALYLAEVLQQNSKLRHLDLTGNQVGCLAATAFAESLAYNLTLQELILTKNQIRTDGAYALALALGKPTCSTAIKTISWNENPISKEGLQALERVPQLRNNQRIWLGDTLRALAKGKISSVNFMNHMTGDEELLLLSEIMTNHTPLVRSLWLSGRMATSRGILPLIDQSLPSPSNVERIYIRYFDCGDDIAESFGRVLCRNITLGVLSITDCDMTETGAAALADGLRNNSTLRRLNLDRNRIGDIGMKSISNALPHPSLVSLAVCRNNITDKVMAIENLKTLQELHLSWNRITNAGALDFCKFLDDGECRLVYLSLRENAISRIAGETLQKFLPDDAVVEY